MVKIKEKFKRVIVAMLCMVIAVCFAACKPSDVGPGGGGGGGDTPGDDEDYYVTSFEITKNPTRLSYMEGETIDLNGIDVKITWNDGVVWTLSGGDITLSDLTVRPRVMAADTEKLEIIFDEYIQEIPLAVAEPDSIEVEREPAKVVYKVGDIFDPSGLRIKVNIGSSVIYTDNFDYYPKGALTADVKAITVEYRGKTVSVPITVSLDTFYIEAEDCELIDGGYGIIGKKAEKSPPGSAGSDLLEKASGGDFVVDAYPKDKIRFTVNSPEAYRATLKLAASSNATEVGDGTQSTPSIANDMQINKVYKFAVNGENVEIGDDIILRGVEIPGGSRETWVYWRTVDIGEILLRKGENTIELSVIDGGGYKSSYGQAVFGQIDAFSIVFDEQIDENTHFIYSVPEKASTCAEQGYSAHYACKACDKLFADENGTQVISPESVKLPLSTKHTIDTIAAKAASCFEAGVKEHYGCKVCGKFFADADGNGEADESSFEIAAYGSHLYNAARYVDEQTHTKTCVRCNQSVTEQHDHEDGKGHLTVAKNPHKVWYYEGQTLDTDRMEAYLSDICAYGCKNSEKISNSDLTVTYQDGNAFKAGDTYVTLSYTRDGVEYTGKVNVFVVANSSDIITVDNNDAGCELIQGSASKALVNRNNDTGMVGQAGYGGSYINDIYAGSTVKFTFDAGAMTNGRIVLQAASIRVVAGNKDQGNPEYADASLVSAIMTIKVNGTVVDLGSMMLKGSVSNIDPTVNRWVWTNWTSVDLGVFELLNGTNTVEINFKNDLGYKDSYGNASSCVVDCLNVLSSIGE